MSVQLWTLAIVHPSRRQKRKQLYIYFEYAYKLALLQLSLCAQRQLVLGPLLHFAVSVFIKLNLALATGGALVAGIGGNSIISPLHWR